MLRPRRPKGHPGGLWKCYMQLQLPFLQKERVHVMAIPGSSGVGCISQKQLWWCTEHGSSSSPYRVVVMASCSLGLGLRIGTEGIAQLFRLSAYYQDFTLEKQSYATLFIRKSHMKKPEAISFSSLLICRKKGT